MNPNLFRTKFAALCLATAVAATGITLAEMQTAHSAPYTEKVTAEHVAKAPTPAPADDDAAGYAAREKTATRQQAYKGGNMIIVGISTTAAIVILVLALLIL